MSIDPQPVPSDPPIVEGISPAEEAFERWRRIVGAVLAPVLFVATYLWLRDSALSREGRMLSCVLAAVGVLWVSEALPLAVTALLAATLCVITGVASDKVVLRYFADPIVFLFIGSFIIARAMTLHGLDRRIALAFLSLPWVGGHPARLLAGVGTVSAFISMWISNTATTAMMLPIALGVLRALHQVRVARGEVPAGAMNPRAWPFATAMMVTVAYAASVGGLGTPVGTPPNLIGLGVIRDRLHVDLGFVRWMALCVPMVVVMCGLLFVLLYLLHPDRKGKDEGGRKKDEMATSPSSFILPPSSSSLTDYLRLERDRLGPWTRGQVNTLIAFGVAVVLWVLPAVEAIEATAALGAWTKAHVPEAVAAIVASVLLFALPTRVGFGRGGKTEFTITWAEAARIDWGTILLFGAGLSLGALMFETGVAKALGETLTARLGPQSVWALTALSIAMAIVLSEATSNTAAATMMVPTVIALAQTTGVSPLPPALGACIGASFGFMLPVSTAPNAIVYGTGLVTIPSMIRAGVLFDVIGFVIIWVGLRLLCPALGLM